MEIHSKELLPVVTENDILAVRMQVKERCRQIHLSVLGQTKVMTVASELARNSIEHGGGGSVEIKTLCERGRLGISLKFEDHGPGIEDIALALTDGYSTKSGLGLGLPGAQRLMDTFEIKSTVGVGTVVVTEKWN